MFDIKNMNSGGTCIMRAFIQNTFIAKTLVFLIVLQLFVGALPQNLLAGNDKERIPPIILHVPVKTAVEGENIIISAVLTDQSGVKEAELQYKKVGDKKYTTLDLRKITEKGTIRIKITAEKASIHEEAKVKSQVLKTARKDEEYYTAEGKTINGFYHIKLGKDKQGWVAVEQAKPVLTGDFYLGFIPSPETYTSLIRYRLKGVDVYDNFIYTPVYKITILKKKKERKKEHEEKKIAKGSSFWSSTWFWGGMALIAGGTAYYFKTQQNKEKKGRVYFEIEW